MARTEPGKVENEAAIAELKREERIGFNLECKHAVAGYIRPEDTDSGLTCYRVVAFDERFGDSLIVAEFPFNNTHEGQFYRTRARIMADALADQINTEKA